MAVTVSAAVDSEVAEALVEVAVALEEAVHSVEAEVLAVVDPLTPLASARIVPALTGVDMVTVAEATVEGMVPGSD